MSFIIQHSSFPFIVLAVSGNNGRIQLCNVEDSSTLHALHIPGPVTSMTWGSEVMSEVKVSEGEEPGKDCFQDMSAHYLPTLPPFSKT